MNFENEYVSFNERGNEESERKLDYKIIIYGIIGSLSSLQFGYHISEYNLPEKEFLECVVKNNQDLYPNLPTCILLDKHQFSFLTGLLPLFSLFGTFLAPILLSKLNSKSSLLLNNIFFVIGSLFNSLSFNYFHLLIGRALCGLGSGIAMVVVPIYLTQIAPLNYKGLLGTFNQLFIVLGIVITMLIGFFYSWRFILFIGIIIPFIQIILFSYFKSNNDTENEYQVIEEGIEHENDNSDDNDNQNINSSTSNDNSFFKNCLSIFLNNKYNKCLLLLLFLHISQQMSGINSIMYFSTTILKDLKGVDAKLISLLLNLFQLMITLFITKIIEVKGRRVLFLYSCLTMSVALFGLAFSLNYNLIILATLFLFLSIIGYSIGLGALPFLLIGEFFEGEFLTVASTLSLITNLLGNFLIASLFLPFTELFPKDQIGSPFLLFSIYLLIAAIISYFIFPETKNNTVAQNQNNLYLNVQKLF
ncbi:MFS general substrate transporter [Neoconidiobolus thromboides FSU 785]|nr:MFS general substrate transporter [Neoconidiobolus thromboides FSU 785]